MHPSITLGIVGVAASLLSVLLVGCKYPQPITIAEECEAGVTHVAARHTPYPRRHRRIPHEACACCFTMPSLGDGTTIYESIRTGEDAEYVIRRNIPTDTKRVMAAGFSQIEIARVRFRNESAVWGIPGVHGIGIGGPGIVVSILPGYDASLIPTHLEGVPVGVEVRDLLQIRPHRPSPAERERAARQREADWQEAVKRNPACPDLRKRVQDSLQALEAACRDDPFPDLPVEATKWTLGESGKPIKRNPDCHPSVKRYHANVQALREECSVIQ